MDAAALSRKQIVKSVGTTTSEYLLEIINNIIMQRPGYNQGFPGQGGMNNGMPMQPGAPGGPARFNNPGGPTYAPGYGQPMGGPQQQQNFQPNAGCFMPAATIRKISNTTPPQRFDPSFH